MQRYFLFLFFLLSFLTPYADAQFGSFPRPGPSEDDEKPSQPVLQLQTSYPSPTGNYNKLATNQLQFVCQDEPLEGCSATSRGAMYLDCQDNQYYSCDGVASWVSTGIGLWNKDDQKKTIYPADIKDSSSEYKLTLGTTDPSFLLTLGGDGSILSKTSCVTTSRSEGNGPYQPPYIITTWGCDPLPAQTGGPIFTWYSSLMALRAGIFEDDWDDNIGSVSVAFGDNPVASAGYSNVLGGLDNAVSGTFSTIAGGGRNTVDGVAANIAGGYNNQILNKGTSFPSTPGNLSYYSTIGGGTDQTILASYSTISGGGDNSIEIYDTLPAFTGYGYSTISGGLGNRIEQSNYATITGGNGNQIASMADYATISGGVSHDITAKNAAIAGGYNNTATGEDSTVAGGANNTASGIGSIVLGGDSNTAGGDYSLAAGKNMMLGSTADRTFVWGYSDPSSLSISKSDAFLIFPNYSSGKVGIGTGSPWRTLQVVTYSDEFLPASFTNEDNVGIVLGALSGADSGEIQTIDFEAGTYNLPLFIQPDGGRVLIGTRTSPNPATIFTVKNIPQSANVSYRNLIYNPTTGGIYYRTTSSSIKFKKDVKPFQDNFAQLLNTSPVSFRYKENNEEDIGYIAEEFDRIGLKNLVIYEDDKPYGLRYEKIPIYLLEIIKNQHKEIEGLNDRLHNLEMKLDKLGP